MASEWSVGCSDDEHALTNDEWEPSPEEIVKLYQTLNGDKAVIELEWQCPGRRPPSPTPNDFYQENEESQESKPEVKSDFEFMDDLTAPSFTPRRGGEGAPKGSAKKKTTSFDGVLSNMRRHRKLEELEKQAGNP